MNKNTICNEQLKAEALEFAQTLAEQYFVKRNFDRLAQSLDEEISCIGTGEDEISLNAREMEVALSREFHEYPGEFTIDRQWLRAVPCSDTCCLVYGLVNAVPRDRSLSDNKQRFTLLLDKTPLGMKIVHMHFSHPDEQQERGHYYVQRAARASNKELRQKLDIRTQQLDVLNRNIPGGAHQCKNDARFTLISMSDSFLSMVGYTREEIETLFHNHFIEMVYPADRTTLLDTTREQLKKGRDIELEYRLTRKTGPPIWILDKGRLLDGGSGEENFFCLLIEITDRKQAQEALRLSLDRHQIIVNQTTDIIFEWDIPNDTLLFSPNWRKKFGYDAISEEISRRIPLSPNIHPDDIPCFVKIMKDIAAGTPYSESEFRIRVTTQFDADGRPIKAVGVIVDIDNEKKQVQVLLNQAQKDALTGLYNKEITRTMVERLRTANPAGALQAMLILDIDHFKKVNDTYGHLAGDSLLSDVAATIKANLREHDIAGRIGGDEFLIFLSQVSDRTDITKRVEMLLDKLGMITPEKGAAPISCSIGAVIPDFDETDYRTIYKHADLALYARKNSGRSGFTLYTPELLKNPEADRRTAVDEKMVSDGMETSDAQLSQYAFRMLYSATDTAAAVNRLLEIIGRSYDVSRAYIFENSRDGLYCSNTFEWCADGVVPQRERLQNLPYTGNLDGVPDDYRKNFDEHGIFYCSNIKKTPPRVRAILEPQGIRSLLQCAMLDEQEFVGYVGFDECRENKQWTTQQMAAFKLTADVLSTFIVKLRQKQRLKKENRENTSFQ